MSNLNNHLIQHLREQIALEEHVNRVIADQISTIKEDEFADAKNLLIATRETLERHYLPLNEMLDRVEKNEANARISAATRNGDMVTNEQSGGDKEQKQISRMLRDDYSALNLVTMSNTLLHTIALALNSQEVAAIALMHLTNLAPLVVKIGKLVPDVVARELYTESSSIDLTVGAVALNNTQLAWKNAT